MKILCYVLCLIVVTVQNAWPHIKVTDSQFEEKNLGVVKILFTGELKEIPEINVHDNLITITIPDSNIDDKIEKKLTLKNETHINYEAYQFDQTTTKFKIVFDDKIEPLKDQVNLVLEEQYMTINFPINYHSEEKKIAPNQNEIAKESLFSQNIKETKEAVKSKNPTKKIDESYLEKIMREDEKMEQEKPNVPIKTESNLFLQEKNNKKPLISTDKNKKIESSPNSFLGIYIAKLVGVILLVIALFYLKVYLFKKGIFNKSKFNFLNNAKLVSVVDNTYLAPKRSLVTIKVNNQLFLLSNTESGISLISEINSPISMLKEAEKNIGGNNFDTKLSAASVNDLKSEKKIKIKSISQIENDLNQSEFESLAEETNLKPMDYLRTQEVQDKVSFSGQLKKKIQSLRPLN